MSGELVSKYNSLARFPKYRCVLFPSEIHYEDVSFWITVFCKELFCDAKCWSRTHRLQRDLYSQLIIEHHKSYLKALKSEKDCDYKLLANDRYLWCSFNEQLFPYKLCTK